MTRQQQIALLKRLLLHVDAKTTHLADAPWRNDVSVYTDPAHHARERQILFRQRPLLMGFASEWAGPGAFRTDDYAGLPSSSPAVATRNCAPFSPCAAIAGPRWRKAAARPASFPALTMHGPTIWLAG